MNENRQSKLLEELINIAAEFYGVTPEKMKARNQHAEESRRRVVLAIVLIQLGFILEDIGEYIGIHYTTIIYHEKQHSYRLEYEQVYNYYYNNLKKLFNKHLKVIGSENENIEI